MKTRKLLALMLVLSFLLSIVSACSPQQSASPAKTPKKVALLLTSPINDAGWGESSYKGLLKAKEKYGIETAYTENLKLADMEPAGRDFAKLGYDIIVLSGADFYQSAIALAPAYPNIRFVLINGEAGKAPNLANYRPNTPECGFVAGAFAGLITKSNKVGMVAGKSLPPVVDATKGFAAGAKYVNPNVEVLTPFIDSWTDIAKGTEAALAMIEGGADVVVPNASSAGLGVIDAAKKKGVYAVGYITDQNKVAPGTVPFSAMQDLGDAVYEGITAALGDNFKAETIAVGAKANVIRLSDFYTMGDKPVPPEVVAKMKEIYQKLVDGSLKDQGILPKSSFEK